MDDRKKLFIHGGSSLISKYLIKRLCLEFNEIHIFCRDIKKTKSIIEVEDYKDLEFYFYENELENIDQTLKDIDKLPNIRQEFCGLVGILVIHIKSLRMRT